LQDLHQVDSLRRIDELKFECENVHIENKRLAQENAGMAEANNKWDIMLLKLSLRSSFLFLGLR